MGNSGKYFLCIIFTIASLAVRGQSLDFALKTGPNVNFNFTTVQQYVSGKTIMDAVTLNVVAVGTQWDLYVGATTTVAGQWDVVTSYSPTYGTLPTIDILKLQFRNMSNTSLVSGFFPLTDVSAPVYIIGTAAAPDATLACPNNGTNSPGSYLANPNCYQFKVDMRIVPGFDLRPGLYTLRVDYYLVEDL
jgi:hypothetical protein